MVLAFRKAKDLPNMALMWMVFSVLISAFCSCVSARRSSVFKEELLADGCKHDDRTFRCVAYIHNYDGDTITVDIPGVHPLLGKKVSVRVRDVDTPEMRGQQACEKEVARIAQKLVESELRKAKQIDLLNVGRDKYFRVLADVAADDQLIKDLLLKNRLAYEYHGGRKQQVDWCQVMKKVP